jgi:NADH-quinone oxidoreductase subunit A
MQVLYWPMVVYFFSVILMAAAIIGISYVLGERHKERVTGQPYESGIKTTGSARQRISVRYYLVAMFFVVFDVESIFIFAWAVSLREIGWAGFFEMLVFIAILVISLIYLWQQGALDWGTSKYRKLTKL